MGGRAPTLAFACLNPDPRVELTAIGGVPVYGELLCKIDQQQKGDWHTVAADVFIGEGESQVVANVAKIDSAVRFRLLAVTGWFEPARRIPMC